MWFCWTQTKIHNTIRGRPSETMTTTIKRLEGILASNNSIAWKFAFVLVPPKVSALIKNQSVPLNFTFEIKCYVKGDPPPKVNWSKDGLDLDIKENTLIINRVTFEDAGWYLCNAKNWAGKIQAKFWIDVTGKWPLRSYLDFFLLNYHWILCQFFGSTQAWAGFRYRYREISRFNA